MKGLFHLIFLQLCITWSCCSAQDGFEPDANGLISSVSPINTAINVSYPKCVSIDKVVLNGVMVHGENVMLSDVIQGINGSNYDFLIVLSSKRFIIDQDFKSEGLKMVVISPTWAVYGIRKISVDGSHGEMKKEITQSNGSIKTEWKPEIPGRDGYSAEEYEYELRKYWEAYRRGDNITSLHPDERAMDGLSGDPGRTGGIFLGIGETFVNGKNLTITANGGNGYLGSGGSNGGEGKKGLSPVRLDKDTVDCETASHCIQNGNISTQSYYCHESDHDNTTKEFSCTGQEVVEPDTSRTECRIKIYGFPGNVGQDGGSGGSGGPGGHPGILEFIDLSEESEVTIENRPGDRGADGRGGPGGKGGFRGDTIVYSITEEDGEVVQYSMQVYQSQERNKTGSQGQVRNDSFENPYPLSVQWLDSSHADRVMSEYRSFLIKNFKDPNPFQEKYLTAFYSRVDSNTYEKRCPKYTISQLIDNLREIEEDYHKFNKPEEFLVLYETLLEKIRTHMNHPCSDVRSTEINNKVDENTWKSQLKPQSMKLLRYMYTATLGRVHSMKEYTNTVVITDIGEYLNSVNTLVQELKEVKGERNKFLMTLSKLNMVEKHKTDYGKYIANKFEEANNLIKKEIFPEIDRINKETLENIDSFLEEIKQLKKRLENQLEKLEEHKKKLKEAMVVHCIFNVFKTAASFLSFIPMAGPIIKTAAQIAGDFGEMMYDHFNPNVLEDLPELADIGNNINEFNDAFKEANVKKVNDDKKQLKIEYKYTQLKELAKKAGEIASGNGDDSGNEDDKKKGNDGGNKEENNESVNNKDFKDDKSVSKDPKEDNLGKKEKNDEEEKKRKEDTEKKRKEEEEKKIKEETEKKRKEQEEKIKEAKKKKKEKIKKARKELGNGAKSIITQFIDDADKIKEVENRIEEVKDKIVDVKKLEDFVSGSFKDSMKNMGKDVKAAAARLKGKSKVTLDVTKWRIQKTLKKVMRGIKGITNGFEIQDKMVHCIEDMSSAMETLIELFDQIQDYQEQLDLANFIADVSIASATDTNITNTEFRNITHYLELMISSNLLLQKYQEAVNAFKQFVFPFAHLYFDGLTLPASITVGDSLEDLVNTASIQVNYLVKRLNDYKQTIQKQDKNIGIGKFSSEFETTKPFFVWENSNYRDSILKLLSCEEVVLKADVRYSPKFEDAIKFNSIEFNFKVTKDYEQTQPKLDRVLKKFEVMATHMGTSYYRYQNKSYMIMSNSLSFWYNIERDNDGNPVRRDKSYDKLVRGDYSLSPYSLWKVQLSDLTDDYDCDDLKEYFDKVDVELVGEGHYVKANTEQDTKLMVDAYYKRLDTEQPDELVKEKNRDLDILMKISEFRERARINSGLEEKSEDESRSNTVDMTIPYIRKIQDPCKESQHLKNTTSEKVS